MKNSFTFAEYIEYTALIGDENGKVVLGDFSGKTPPFVPQQIAYLNIHKDFNIGLNIGAGIRYVGDQYADLNNDFELDSYVIYQSFLGFDTKNWSVKLNVSRFSRDNVISRGLGFYSVVPVEPLEIKGSIEAVF